MANKGFFAVNAGITAHAWNHDGSRLALSPNNHELHIYDTSSKTVEAEKVYNQQHIQTITSVDWSPVTNLIVTASHDRTAAVWRLNDATGEYMPEMCVLKESSRAATQAKWSPDGSRFAVGHGTGAVHVCTFHEDNTWWLGKTVDAPLGSTVLALEFHPQNVLLACGGVDNELRIYSTVDKKLDAKATAKAVFGEAGKPPKFGQLLMTAAAHAWVEAVAWAPNGESVAFASHDSRISVVTIATGDNFGSFEVQPIRLRTLPMTSLLFLDNTTLVGAGYDHDPLKLTFDGSSWSVEGNLDAKKKSANTTRSVREMRKDEADRGGASVHQSLTVHENTITSICKLTDDGQFSTAGLDGRIVFWNTGGGADRFAGLALDGR